MWLWWLCLACVVWAKEQFHEEISISRLPSDNILAHFRFTIQGAEKERGRTSLLYSSLLSNLINKYALDELSFSLTQSVWRDKWGLPPSPSSPHGAHIHAWFRGDNDTSIDTKWVSLVNTLNGIFCTSLSAMTEHKSAPRHSIKPRGPTANASQYASLRVGRIAEETVCTENLTPWKKMLPCKEKGLAGLLNPLKLFDSSFYSMSLHTFLECPQGKETCSSPTWRSDMSISIVFDLPIKSRKLDWSLSSLFDTTMSGECPVAETSSLIVHDSHYDAEYTCPTNVVKSVGPKDFRFYNLKKGCEDKFMRDFHATYGSRLTLHSRRPKGLSVHTDLFGAEQRGGRIVSTLSNTASSPKEVLFVQIVPWYVQVHYASLSIRCGEKTPKFTRHFTPALMRVRPALLEYTFQVPANTDCEISFHFDKAFLRIDEYPSDANHGMYVPPATVYLLDGYLDDENVLGSEWVTGREVATGQKTAPKPQNNGRLAPAVPVLHGNPLLVPLPVPDFSMPFNVEAFVCVVISYCFTPLLSFAAYVMTPVGTELPAVSRTKKFGRLLLYALTAGALYCEVNEISPAQIARIIRKQLELLKEMFA